MRVLGRNGHRPAPLPQLCDRLLASRGEASSLALADALVGRVATLDQAQTLAFLELLSQRFGPSPASVRIAAAAYLQQPDQQRLDQLTRSVKAPRLELFGRLNQVPGGTAALVELRRRLLALLPSHPALAPVDADLRGRFAAWFNRGFLSLEQITWQSPAHVLERLIEDEVVHQIQGWPDLRARLAPDRCCYAFFHPAMPREPLIFVEVALTRPLST